MTGWEKVAAATLLAAIGLLGLNLAIWRRVRAAVRLAPQVQDQRERDVQSQDVDFV